VTSPLKPNVLVCGYTGSGKTSLLQSFCGEDVVPPEAIGHGEPETFEFNRYETDDVVFNDSRGMEMGQREDEFRDYVREFVRSRQAEDDVGSHIHVMWYCIAGDRARVTELDRKLIDGLFPTTLVAVTKNDIMRPQQREGITEALLEAGVPLEHIVFCSSQDGSGLGRLLELTSESMSVALRKALESLLVLRQEEFRDRADAAANTIVMNSTKQSAAVGCLPFAMFALPVFFTTLDQMVVGVAAAYGQAMTKEMTDRFRTRVGIGTFGMFLARLVPILRVPLSAGITYGLGRAARSWFRTEMRLPDEDLRRIYMANRKRGIKGYGEQLALSPPEPEEGEQQGD